MGSTVADVERGANRPHLNPGTTVSALLSSRVLSPAHLSESRGVLGAVGQKEPGIVGEYAFIGPSGVGSLPVVEL